MLTRQDIDFMRDSQDEIYTLRQRSITLISLDKIYDDVTGQLIGEQERTHDVQAVITELSISGRSGSRYIEGGIEYEQGDIKIDVKIEYVNGESSHYFLSNTQHVSGLPRDIADKVIRAEFDGLKYELLGGDRKGIGKRNRYEFIGREIA